MNGIFDPFMLRVEVAFFFGLVVTSPIWLYQLWAFVAPGCTAARSGGPTRSWAVAVPLFLAAR